MLIYYLSGLNYTALWLSARRFPVGVGVLILGLNVVPGGVKYIRWRRVLSEMQLVAKGWRGYLVINAAFFLGLVTPGTSGELSRAWIGNGGEARERSAAIVFEKLTDLLVLVVFATASAAIQLTEGASLLGVIALILTVVGALYVVVVNFDWILTAPLKLLVERLVPEARLSPVREAYWRFYELLEDRNLVLMSLLASSALWSVTLLQMHLIFSGLGWDVPLKTSALALFLPYLVGVVSMIPLGLGVFEVTMSKAMSVGVVGGLGSGAALGPLFFRFLVTLPLIVGGYACHVALTFGPKARVR